jgi:hypothetical protein
LPPKTPDVPELHNDAPSRITTQSIIVIKNNMVKGIHPEPSAKRYPLRIP